MISARAANRLWHLAAQRRRRHFARALATPESAQASLLLRLVQRNAATEIGRALEFAKFSTVADFQSAVPLSEYSDYEAYIERIVHGAPRVLTREPVTRLVPTSGSTAARKLIPWTTGLQREFDRAIGAWVGDLFTEFPQLRDGPAYWSVSPAIPQAQDDQQAVVKVGFDDDTSYLGGLVARLVGRIMAVPAGVRLATDTATFRYLVLLHLAAARDLRLVSVWHPTFFTLLLDSLPDHFGRIIDSLKDGVIRPPRALPHALMQQLQKRFKADPGRAAELQGLDPCRPGSMWPQLGLLSAWGDADSPERDALAARFPQARFQEKGLLATEAFITIPYGGQLPLAITSHYFEFLDRQGSAHLAHQLDQSQRYEVVVTTAGGLYRYRLGDQVEVTGFVGSTPALRFVGRVGVVSDLRGEKLDGRFVAQAIVEASRQFAAALRFRLLVADLGADPAGHAPGYVLVFVADPQPGAGSHLDPDRLAADLDEALCANPHYRLCRFLGQLRPLRAVAVDPPAIDAYFHWRTSRGQKLGDIKPAVIDSGAGLLEALGVPRV